MCQNLDVLLLKEGYSDLGFVDFAQLWNQYIPGTVVDDVTFFIHVKHPHG